MKTQWTWKEAMWLSDKSHTDVHLEQVKSLIISVDYIHYIKLFLRIAAVWRKLHVQVTSVPKISSVSNYYIQRGKEKGNGIFFPFFYFFIFFYYDHLMEDFITCPGHWYLQSESLQKNLQVNSHFQLLVADNLFDPISMETSRIMKIKRVLKVFKIPICCLQWDDLHRNGIREV